METEIELKFFVSPSFLTQIEDVISDVKVLQKRQRQLQNTYFDTQDFLLRHHDIGLRIRRFDEVFVQTLKTAGRVVAGLHQRPEYNAELATNTLDLSLIPDDALPEDFNKDELQSSLIPIFSTDFTRHHWLIAMPDSSQIELAFDLGTVTADDEAQDSICEVEIELKSGQIDALFIFARELAEKGNLRLGNLSKAARGYRLATDYQGDKVYPLNEIALQRGLSVEQGFVETLEEILAHWHYHEQIYIERQDEEALTQIVNSVRLLRQTLSLYGDCIPRRASALLRQELHWLEVELSWVFDAHILTRLCEDKGYFLRKLNSQKQLYSKFKQDLGEFPQQVQILSLLNSSRYCNLLLDLSRWLLTRGWQPFLDEKGRDKLTSSLSKYAKQALAFNWNDILSLFSIDNDLNAADYIEQYKLLAKSLLSNNCFGSLFETEGQNAFHLAWFDLLQGIEDLYLLEPVRALLLDEAIDDEDKIQIEKWLDRKQASLLHAMMQSRQMGLNIQPYWDI